MTERDLITAAIKAANRGPVRLFRNNVGEAWAGKHTMLADGAVLISRPYRIKYGLMPGSGDLIGWQSVTVTPEMVGSTVAVFVSAEGKTRRGRVAAKQANWREQVDAAGGVAVVFRSVEELTDALK